MADRSDEVLSEAIERNLAAVLSLPSAGMFRHYKTRFLCSVSEGVWIEGVPDEQPLIDSLIKSGQPTGISFRSGTQKVNFAVSILKDDPKYQVNPTTMVRALLLQKPTDVKAIQRRSHYRAPIHEVDRISIQLWRIPEQDPIEKQPQKAAELEASIHNLSVGGMGIMLTGKGDRAKVVAGERVRVILKKSGRDDVLLEGRVGQLRKNDTGTLETGVQFVGLQARLEGRQILNDLTKLVGELQREEVKRMRRA